MKTTTPATTQIRQTVPLLLVSDLGATLRFYQDGLGFDVADTWEPEGKLAWCWLTQGGAALMLQQTCEEDPPISECGQGVTLYFLCDDANEVFRRITAAGVQATEPADAFYGMNQTFVTDPDGYSLCFENRTTRPGGDSSGG